MAALIRDTREMSYLVLTHRAVPYLLARLRWPDVAQAMTVSNPRWLEDPGLFDLHYDSSAVNVGFSQAASVAAGWGIEFAGSGRGSSRRVLRSQHAHKKAAPVSGATRGPESALVERRREQRVRINGRVHIRSGTATISAGLVDLSHSGIRFVQPEPPAALAAGVTLDGPFLFEAEGNASRICLDVAGRIVWRRSIGPDTHFGVAFGNLADAETEGLQLFLAAARA